MRRILLFLICICGCILSAQAQVRHNHHEPCATMEEDSISRARFPIRGTLNDFEIAVQSKIEEMELLRKQGRIMAGVINIPIVVHVVHNGEAIGTGMNISQAQVQAQIDVLNEDFRRKPGTPGYNTNPVGADVEIEFCLSPVDENGVVLTEPGIDRVDGNRPDWSRDLIEGQLKPSTIWNPNMFFNIWTVKFAASDANLLGYAQFPDQSGLAGLPDSGPASTDGVVIRYQSFGSVDKGNFPVMEAPYNKGRTLSHETGHWLGLRHIWGDGVCADDFVADTPTQRNASSGCPNSLSCNNSTPAMVQNYMDYSNDACMNVFTQGQKARMLAVMEVSPRRKTLILANLCSPIVADVPTPNFTVDNQTILLGGEANFTDLSTNFPNAWQWTFEGGDPSTSTARNPKVKYTIPGTYKVTLVVTNTLGSATLEIDDYITVSEEGLCGNVSNFDDSFTPSVLPLSDFGPYTGYLTGHNSIKTKALAEYFKNQLGYAYISGVKIRFRSLSTFEEDATVKVTVWNARGPQGAPGSIIEQKTVLLKQIKDDIDNNRATSITFDRETPVFNKPYQVGVVLDYPGYTLAVESSANGEGLDATSWLQDQNGVWTPFATAYGANIAMNIEGAIGMNTSVQVSASDQLIYPGQQVTLNGRGASVFIWNSDDGTVEDVAGPQIVVYPNKQTTYLTIGSGMDLCVDSTYTTIYLRENVLAEEKPLASGIELYPNPGTSQLQVTIENEFSGPVHFQLLNAVGGKALATEVLQKTTHKLVHTISITTLASGVYIVQIKMGEGLVTKKWIKR